MAGIVPGVSALGPATPRGVVFQELDQLKCVDPLSGELLWARSDVPVGCELLGDTEFVFAADISAHTAHVIRMIDGDIEGQRKLLAKDWLITSGRNIATMAMFPKWIIPGADMGFPAKGLLKDMTCFLDGARKQGSPLPLGGAMEAAAKRFSGASPDVDMMRAFEFIRDGK